MYTGFEAFWPLTQELKHLISFIVCLRGDGCLSVCWCLPMIHCALHLRSPQRWCVWPSGKGCPPYSFWGRPYPAAWHSLPGWWGDRKQGRKNNINQSPIRDIISSTYSSFDPSVLMFPMHLNTPRHHMWLISAGKPWLPTWLARIAPYTHTHIYIRMFIRLMTWIKIRHVVESGYDGLWLEIASGFTAKFCG